MIRPFTVLCLLTACGSGLYLYSEKHRTELLDRDIGRVIHATEAARARTGMLRAEWALLNEPGRLQDMAGRYLTLHPMAPTQFVPVAELAAHLPAPVTTPLGGPIDDDDTPPAAAPAEPLVASAASADQDRVAAHTLAAADAKPGPKLLASASANTHAHASHRLALADRSEPSLHNGLLTHGTPLPLAAPQPMGASVYSAMARPMRTSAPRPTIVAAVPSYAPAQRYAPSSYASSSTVQSALGGGAALPPPVPYGR